MLRFRRQTGRKDAGAGRTDGDAPVRDSPVGAWSWSAFGVAPVANRGQRPGALRCSRITGGNRITTDANENCGIATEGRFAFVAVRRLFCYLSWRYLLIVHASTELASVQLQPPAISQVLTTPDKTGDKVIGSQA